MDNTFKEVDERIEAFFNDSSNYDEYSDYSDCCGECGGDLLIENVKDFIHKERSRARNEGIEEGKREILEIKLKDWKNHEDDCECAPCKIYWESWSKKAQELSSLKRE